MRVGIIGLGTVGKGVYEMLQDTEIEIIKVINKSKAGDYPEMVYDIDEIIFDDSIDTIVELVGGIELPYYISTNALKQGKHVVTANKALLSRHLKELDELAKKQNVKLLYEASCCGGITVVNPLSYITKTNIVDSVTGILNGSTNFILTKVFNENSTIDKAIEEAYALGYLETGSNDDLLGIDAKRKLNILSSISYHMYLNEDDIYVKELSLTDNMIAYIKANNHSVRYLAHSTCNETISMRVEPLLLKNSSRFASILNGDNLVCFTSNYLGEFSYKGPGAGRYETASAVMNDLLIIQKDNYIQNDFNKKLKKMNNNIQSDYLVEYKNEIKVEKNIFESDIVDAISYIRIAGDEIA